MPQDERPDSDEIKDIIKDNLADKGEIIDKNISNEEAVGLYYIHKSAQLQKDQISIYAANSINNTQENNTISSDDINKLHKQVVGGMVLDNISNT